MGKPIEEHMADFLLANPGPSFLAYRRRCLEFWRGLYGPSITARVEALVAKRWKESGK